MDNITFKNIHLILESMTGPLVDIREGLFKVGSKYLSFSGRVFEQPSIQQGLPVQA